ncbi:MAG: hypothetical protein MN733_28310, partial [Nitrososphaera sp.]|nr:hypothetical protein [Nitrososphaera sp.]
VALLEHITEPIIGSASQEILKAPVIEKELLDSLGRILVYTEQRFVKECMDVELRQAILALPLADVPSIKQAVRAFYDRPADSTFSEILHERLAKDFPNLPEHRIKSAISDYLRILRQELVSFSAHIRELLSALAIQDIQANTAQIVELLKSIHAIEKREQIEPQILSIHPLFDDYLSVVKERLEEARGKFPQDPQRNLLDFYIEPMGSIEPPPKNLGVATTSNAPKSVGLWELIRPSLEKGKPCILLADFGMGKSWFLEAIQYRLALDLLVGGDNPPSTWLPLRLSLRGFRRESVPPEVMPLLSLMGLMGAKPKPRAVFDQLREKAWMAALGETQTR